MLTNEFRIFDPLKDDVNTVPTLSGNYIFALRKNSKLPDIGIPVIYTKFRDYEVIYVGLASTSLRDRDVEKHFNGNAGSSTLRKSLGCLFGYNYHEIHIIITTGKLNLMLPMKASSQIGLKQIYYCFIIPIKNLTALNLF